MAEYIVDSDRSRVPEAWFELYAERELVRCRDCKHAPQGVCKLLKWRHNDCPVMVAPNFFCAQGERKGDE